MGYSMAARSDMRYTDKNKKKLTYEKYPNNFKGHMKMAKDAALTFLTGGTPVVPPKTKKR